jgi:benzoyl-CoA reductase subunit B
MAILGKERTKEMEAIYGGVNRLLDIHMADPKSRAFRTMLMGGKAAAEAMFQALDNKIPVISYNLGGIPEIMLALGDNEGEIFPFAMEKIVAQQALMGDLNYNLECIDLAEAQGLSNDVCSTDRALLGYLMRKVLLESVCAVFVTAPCDSQTAAADFLKELTGKDVFVVDIPNLHGERDIQFVAGQLKDEIKFLEEQTGKKLNWDRLKDICEESNRMVEKSLEWLDWRKTVPCPQTGKVLSFMYILLNDASGTKGGTWAASEWADDAKERALRGEAAADEERIRAIWFGSPIWHNISFYDWMESELGMVIPIDMFSYVVPDMYIDTSDHESILYGLARKQIFMPMGRHFTGAPEYYIDDVVRAVADYKADCVLFAGHMACKHAWGLSGLLKETLREADIPLLTFEFDLFDPRITSVEALKEEFRRFANDIVLPRLEK